MKFQPLSSTLPLTSFYVGQRPIDFVKERLLRQVTLDPPSVEGGTSIIVCVLLQVNYLGFLFGLKVCLASRFAKFKCWSGQSHQQLFQALDFVQCSPANLFKIAQQIAFLDSMLL